MTLDDRIMHAKKLIADREDIDRRLNELFAGIPNSKKGSRCSRCGDEGHNAKTCPTKTRADSDASPDAV